MSYSVIISRQYHSNSAFEMIFVRYKENWQVKNGLCLYGFNAIIWFWMFKSEVWVNFSDDKTNLKTTEIINSIKFACQI